MKKVKKLREMCKKSFKQTCYFYTHKYVEITHLGFQ